MAEVVDIQRPAANPPSAPATGEQRQIVGLSPRDLRVKRGRDIVDPADLNRRLEKDWSETETIEAFRARMLVTLKDVLATGREEIKRRFMETSNGAACVREGAYLMDRLIQTVATTTVDRVYRTSNPTDGEQMAIVAIGGYGRGELAPHSDIDLLFLRPYKQTASGEQVIEFVLYMLWDLGLKVGHATRSVDECLRQARGDMTIRTSLLEARYLWGVPSLADDLRQRFQGELVLGTETEFMEAKLAEAEERHERLGDSRYVIEPNVKDGKGGLRDIHRLFWIGKYLYQVDAVRDLVPRGVLTMEEARRFAKAQKWLWTVRCHLHYLAGRPEERLTVDLQPEIAARCGYTDRAGQVAVERFMKHFYLVAKDVGDLTRILCAAVEADRGRKPRFRLLPRFFGGPRLIGDLKIEGERVTVADDQAFERDPVNMLRLFRVAQSENVGLHPHALRLITQCLKTVGADLRKDPKANRLFLEIVAAPEGPERILRRMNESQLLGRFIPDFGRVVAQMQYDMYHVYTTDEHTLIMLGILHRIEKGELSEEAPIATEVVHKVQSRRALFVAAFLHDICKGRGGDHSILGEKAARRLCPRFGMTDEETETVAWLVRWHLLMSYAAFKRDVSDPKTVQDFCEIVRSPERLKLLLVLTVADIRAVGPTVWNGWKASLLRELYWSADEVLSGDAKGAGKRVRIAAAKDALSERLSDWSAEDLEAHLARPYDAYWIVFDTEHHARHAEMMRRAEADKAPLTVEARVDTARDATEITVYAADHPGLFSRIAGALPASGADIVDARITTMKNGMVLDVFWVQGEGRSAFDRPDKLARLSARIQRALAGQMDIDAEVEKRRPRFPKRTSRMTVPPRVLIDDKASKTHTVIEVNGTDQPGLLYRITRALARINVQIYSARISTYGQSVVDVFYVKDLFGLKIVDPARHEQIREALLEAVTLPSDDTDGA